jgi:uncharacterized protein YndB with AHSA1/START domain
MRQQRKADAAATLAVGILAMAPTNGATAAETHDLSVTRVFEAPVERLWAAWSESDEVKKWWAPIGFTTPVADMDFREGARSVVCMRPPEGPDFCNTWTYQRIVPNESIEFVLGWSDEKGMPVDPPLDRLQESGRRQGGNDRQRVWLRLRGDGRDIEGGPGAGPRQAGGEYRRRIAANPTTGD